LFTNHIIHSLQRRLTMRAFESNCHIHNSFNNNKLSAKYLESHTYSACWYGVVNARHFFVAVSLSSLWVSASCGTVITLLHFGQVLGLPAKSLTACNEA
jgi:hypothetical protein